MTKINDTIYDVLTREKSLNSMINDFSSYLLYCLGFQFQLPEIQYPDCKIYLSQGYWIWISFHALTIQTKYR